MGDAPPPVHISSTRGRRLGVVAFGTVWSAVLVALSRIRLARGFHPLEWLVAAAVFCTLLALYYRSVRMAVVADADGLLIRNTFWTRRLGWADVEGFEGDEPDRRFDSWGIHAVRRGGREVALEAASRSNLLRRNAEVVGGYLEELRAWLPPR